MISLKPKAMSETELIDQLKKVLDACDGADYGTKKFVGLLNDYIPYQTGLKTRLELLGKSGAIEQMTKIKKDAHASSKVEKIALQFSKEYGFIYEESYHTLSLVAKALQLNHTITTAPSLRIVSSVQGNFSKNHIKPEVAQGQNSPSTPKSTLTVHSASSRTQSSSPQPIVGKKRFIRSKGYLTMYLLILFSIPLGYIGLQLQSGQLNETLSTFRDVMMPLSFDNPWVIGLISLTMIATVLPYVVKAAFKKNILSYYPTVIFLSQMLLATVGGLEVALVQLGIGVLLFGSFAILGAYVMRLPRGAKEYVAYKALLPYSLSVAIWLVGQYVIFYKWV